MLSNPRHTGRVRRSAFLPPALVALLVTVLVTVLTTSLLVAPGARPAEAATRASSVTLRLAPPRVTVYEGGMVEPTALVAQVSPARARRTVTFQQRVGSSSWRTLARLATDSTGQASHPLTLRAVGTTYYRAVVGATTSYRSAASSTRSLVANSNDAAVDGRGCRATTAPVDQRATGEVVCLLQRLDAWRSAGLMGVGQQLNVSSGEFLAPLSGIRPHVVGFDLQELADGETYSHRPLDDLVELARRGAVLNASWHADNPFRADGRFGGGPEDLTALLRRSDDDPARRQAYDRFWADWDAKLDLLRRFAVGDTTGTGRADATRQTAVVLRPLHEVNGRFFWWGQPTTGTYRRLWRALQDRAWAAGVHNVVWAYSGNRLTSSTKDPALYLPERVDLAGLDTYDPENGAANAPDVLHLEGWASLARAARERGVNRMALTEVGPHASRDGAWNPAVITSTARRARISPLWAMLWFDDTGYDNAGRKQIVSLTGGRSWLRSCVNSLCLLR